MNSRKQKTNNNRNGKICKIVEKTSFGIARKRAEFQGLPNRVKKCFNNCSIMTYSVFFVQIGMFKINYMTKLYTVR
jgi:hypothetical protein